MTWIFHTDHSGPRPWHSFAARGHTFELFSEHFLYNKTQHFYDPEDIAKIIQSMPAKKQQKIAEDLALLSLLGTTDDLSKTRAAIINILDYGKRIAGTLTVVLIIVSAIITSMDESSWWFLGVSVAMLGFFLSSGSYLMHIFLQRRIRKLKRKLFYHHHQQQQNFATRNTP